MSLTVRSAKCLPIGRVDAGGAYGEAWDLWHRGASEVQQGLAILAEAVGAAGVDFQNQDLRPPRR